MVLTNNFEERPSSHVDVLSDHIWGRSRKEMDKTDRRTLNLGW